MSSAGVGPLCFLKNNVTASVYQAILEHFMLPSADQLFKDADFIFQRDLAPVHTAKSTKSWLNYQLNWPANSLHLHLADAFIQSDLQLHSGYTFSLVYVFPGNWTHNLLHCWRNALPLSHTGTLDLNPMENLWGIVKRKMRNKRPKNADELKATVKETWASITPQQCHKLITSMPRRTEAVIKAKGAPTKYWVHIQ